MLNWSHSKREYAPPYVQMSFKKEERADGCAVKQPLCKVCATPYDLIKYGGISI